MAELARLRAENEALKQRSNKSIVLKVHEKGAISVYGIGRFPVSLYMEQWQKLLAMKGDIEAFIAANKASLKVKGSERLSSEAKPGLKATKANAASGDISPRTANWSEAKYQAGIELAAKQERRAIKRSFQGGLPK